jgi:hypothetical protein
MSQLDLTPASRKHDHIVTTESVNSNTMTDQTEWRIIPGFSKYEINNQGEVRKVDTHYTLSLFKYKTYSLAADDGHITTRTIHTLLSLAFPKRKG